jgi:nitroimidazol reductase NimA-like FMN-containing flavoprotein (pyridoxamine 5'-phosphate oxidase superfamily)
MRELSAEECRHLIRDGGVGRVAFRTPSGQQIVPVNFTLHGDSIVFRTNPYSELGSYGADSEAAIEVDVLDQERRTGWSVVARGRLHVVSSPRELAAIRSDGDPQPWADGVRRLYLKLTWRDITGRRVENAEPPTSPTGGRAIPLDAWTVRGRARRVRRGGQPPRY